MLPLHEAQQRIAAELSPLPVERIPLSQAVDRYAAESVKARSDLPAFDHSAMDGYAVRCDDLSSATASEPVSLRLLGAVPAGEVFSASVNPGECVRLFTGSPMPIGADAVVMQEDTRGDPAQDLKVDFFHAPRPQEHVRRRGDDVRQGKLILDQGQKIGLRHLPLLSALGQATMAVSRTPQVGLLATGSELREVGQPLGPGQIYESNRLMLANLARRVRAGTRCYPLVADSPSAIREALCQALEESDVVVTTGGVSVGDFDFVKSVFSEMGGVISFWKIAMKPGKPLVFGRFKNKTFFGLPGNPVSALVTFVLLVWPALEYLQGAREPRWPHQFAILDEPMSNEGDRLLFSRVVLDEDGQARSAGLQASHALWSMAVANGLLEIPPQTKYPRGARVKVLNLDAI